MNLKDDGNHMQITMNIAESLIFGGLWSVRGIHELSVHVMVETWAKSITTQGLLNLEHAEYVDLIFKSPREMAPMKNLRRIIHWLSGVALYWVKPLIQLLTDSGFPGTQVVFFQHLPPENFLIEMLELIICMKCICHTTESKSFSISDPMMDPLELLPRL